MRAILSDLSGPSCLGPRAPGDVGWPPGSGPAPIGLSVWVGVVSSGVVRLACAEDRRDKAHHTVANNRVLDTKSQGRLIKAVRGV